MTQRVETFAVEPSARWRRYVVGNAALEPTGTTLRLATYDTTAQQYSDAQLDDYQVGGSPRFPWPLRGNPRFPWRPPLRLTVQARFSHPAGELCGTAGFGFWNYPFLLIERRLPRLPQAIWFFYASAPSNMKLDLLTPGGGWKAAMIDAGRPAALALAPFALPAILLIQAPSLYQALWPIIQCGVGVRETPVAATMTAWHTYELIWGVKHSHFSVDGTPVLENAPSPRGPLCFVTWLDNQYMIVTPQGSFGWGLLATEGRQWLEIERVAIEPLG